MVTYSTSITIRYSLSQEYFRTSEIKFQSRLLLKERRCLRLLYLGVLDFIKLLDKVLILFEYLSHSLVLAIGVVDVLELLHLLNLLFALDVLRLARVLESLDLLLNEFQLLLMHLILTKQREVSNSHIKSSVKSDFKYLREEHCKSLLMIFVDFSEGAVIELIAVGVGGRLSVISALSVESSLRSVDLGHDAVCLRRC